MDLQDSEFLYFEYCSHPAVNNIVVHSFVVLFKSNNYETFFCYQILTYSKSHLLTCFV